MYGGSWGAAGDAAASIISPGIVSVVENKDGVVVGRKGGDGGMDFIFSLDPSVRR